MANLLSKTKQTVTAAWPVVQAATIAKFRYVDWATVSLGKGTVVQRVAERVRLPLETHGPPEESKLSRYSQPFLKPCIVIPSKPSFV